MCSLIKMWCLLLSELPAVPKLTESHPVNQVHIDTQTVSHKFPIHSATHPSSKRKPRKSAHKQKGFPTESDVDPVFSLDDFTDDCEPFFESEEDDLSGETSKFILCDVYSQIRNGSYILVMGKDTFVLVGNRLLCSVKLSCPYHV